MAFLVGFLWGSLFGLILTMLRYELGGGKFAKQLWPNEKPYLIRNGDKYGVAMRCCWYTHYYDFECKRYWLSLFDDSWTDRETAEALITNERQEHERVAL